MSISGDVAIVGAYREDEDASGGDTKSNAGSAYIFKREGSTWTQEAKIVASDRDAEDRFGLSVSISGDVAIVGAYGEDHDASGGDTHPTTGSAYIFKCEGSTWTQEAKIVASDRATSDYFGYSVSISGDVAIVGAYQEDEDASGGDYKVSAGSAYIFKCEGSTWTQEAKIVASDRDENDQFGYSVSISGDVAIVGARFENEDASGGATLSFAGSAYIFKRDGSAWIQEAKIVASDRATDDYFGYSVSISGDVAIVGAYQEDEDDSGGATIPFAGSAYVFSVASESATPICLSSFSAQRKKGKVELDWETASETNNAAFILYRNDEAIARIDGAGTTCETNLYSYSDKTVALGQTYTYILADLDYANKETRYTDKAITITMSENVEIDAFTLGNAYPNPFNPSTFINYQLATASNVKLTIYNTKGKEIRTLVNDVQAPGYYIVNFNAGNLPSGTYLYRLSAGNEIITKKMVLMK